MASFHCTVQFEALMLSLACVLLLNAWCCQHGMPGVAAGTTWGPTISASSGQEALTDPVLTPAMFCVLLYAGV